MQFTLATILNGILQESVLGLVLFGTGHLTPNCFNTELFSRQFRDWHVYVMKMGKRMDKTLVHIVILSSTSLTYKLAVEWNVSRFFNVSDEFCCRIFPNITAQRFAIHKKSRNISTMTTFLYFPNTINECPDSWMVNSQLSVLPHHNYSSTTILPPKNFLPPKNLRCAYSSDQKTKSIYFELRPLPPLSYATAEYCSYIF